ncbi:MBL fold metallo-hydrolase [bacterium]|nr:MBL fold metallo-hydrolase [bacterium]
MKAELTVPHARIGGIEVFLLDAGTFRLDGGAMFRVVPKVIWEKRCPADSQNRILLGMRPLLVRAEDGSWVLVESGIGARRRDPKFIEMFDVREGEGLLASLARADVKPEEISKVVVTHMHFDHVGGVVEAPEGTKGPRLHRFPNAKLVVQRGELEDSGAGCDLCKASYVQDDWKALADAGSLEVVDGDREIAPGVRVEKTGGHTRHHQIVRFSSGGEEGVFWGDLIPTSAHIRPHYVMAYDLYPIECWEKKKELVERAVSGKWVSVFYHDPVSPLGRVARDGRDFKVEEVSP